MFSPTLLARVVLEEHIQRNNLIPAEGGSRHRLARMFQGLRIASNFRFVIFVLTKTPKQSLK